MKFSYRTCNILNISDPLKTERRIPDSDTMPKSRTYSPKSIKPKLNVTMLNMWGSLFTSQSPKPPGSAHPSNCSRSYILDQPALHRSNISHWNLHHQISRKLTISSAECFVFSKCLTSVSSKFHEFEDDDQVSSPAKSSDLFYLHWRIGVQGLSELVTILQERSCWEVSCLWKTFKPVPAVKQTPLFEEDLAVDGILEAFENIQPVELFGQLLFHVYIYLQLLNHWCAILNIVFSKLFNDCKEYMK